MLARPEPVCGLAHVHRKVYMAQKAESVEKMRVLVSERLAAWTPGRPVVVSVEYRLPEELARQNDFARCLLQHLVPLDHPNSH